MSRVRPAYLCATDQPWLKELLAEVRACEGLVYHLAETRLRDWLNMRAGVLGVRAKAQLAVRAVLGRVRESARVKPSAAKADIAARIGFFLEGGMPLERVRNSPSRGIFSDLPSQRILTSQATQWTFDDLVTASNTLLVAQLVSSAPVLRVKLCGNSRDVVRLARLKGLICHVQEQATADGLLWIIYISGPLALFRRTRLYKQALCSLFLRIGWAEDFEVAIQQVSDAGTRSIVICKGDPIQLGRASEDFDSKLEEKFSRDFMRLSSDWDLLREPKPLVAGGRLCFPDFGIRHRNDPSRSWLMEIIGFWTKDYLQKKLETYRAVGPMRLILCLREDQNVGEGEFPQGMRIVRFKTRVRAEEILEIVQGLS